MNIACIVVDLDKLLMVNVTFVAGMNYDELHNLIQDYEIHIWVRNKFSKIQTS